MMLAVGLSQRRQTYENHIFYYVEICFLHNHILVFLKFYLFIYLFFGGYLIVVLFILLISFFPFIFISWRPITLQYCSGFCHTLT